MKKLIIMSIFAMLSGLFPCQAIAGNNVVNSAEEFSKTINNKNSK